MAGVEHCTREVRSNCVILRASKQEETWGVRACRIPPKASTRKKELNPLQLRGDRADLAPSCTVPACARRARTKSQICQRSLLRCWLVHFAHRVGWTPNHRKTKQAGREQTTLRRKRQGSTHEETREVSAAAFFASKGPVCTVPPTIPRIRQKNRRRRILVGISGSVNNCVVLTFNMRHAISSLAVTSGFTPPTAAAACLWETSRSSCLDMSLAFQRISDNLCCPLGELRASTRTRRHKHMPRSEPQFKYLP